MSYKTERCDKCNSCIKGITYCDTCGKDIQDDEEISCYKSKPRKDIDDDYEEWNYDFCSKECMFKKLKDEEKKDDKKEN